MLSDVDETWWKFIPRVPPSFLHSSETKITAKNYEKTESNIFKKFKKINDYLHLSVFNDRGVFLMIEFQVTGLYEDPYQLTFGPSWTLSPPS